MFNRVQCPVLPVADRRVLVGCAGALISESSQAEDRAMPVVLIVDDSEVDRRLVGGLLPKDLEWLIEFADNGVECWKKCGCRCRTS